MGIGVIVHGYIACPDGTATCAANARALLDLPESDPEWPFIVRGMFCVSPMRPSLDVCVPQHDCQLIHFAGEYKNMFVLEADWLTKFERLLSRLVWSSAVAFVDFSGLVYTWRVPLEHRLTRYAPPTPRPPNEWSFQVRHLVEEAIELDRAIDGKFISSHHRPPSDVA